MGGGDGDDDGGLTDLDPPHTMLDGGGEDRPAVEGLPTDFGDLSLDVLEVGVVLEEGDPLPSGRVVAGRSREDDRGAGIRASHLGGKGGGVEGPICDLDPEGILMHGHDGSVRVPSHSHPCTVRWRAHPMPDDDIFSQLFRLFNQPGPVNLRLAAEIARHLAGEREPVDPWAAEELRELTRLAELRIGAVAPFPVPSAPDVLPVDGRDWAERNLDGFRYLAEAFAGLSTPDPSDPAAAMLKPVIPALVGMQIGTLVGSLARWVMASFDAGIPVAGSGPISYVVPTIDRFIAEHGVDGREVRLWVALNETAHRAMFRVPFTADHLTELMASHAATMRVAPERLMGLMQGVDPMNPQDVDIEQLAAAFDTPETRRAQAELDSYLGLTNGYRRLLVERSAGDLLPRLDAIDADRDADRDLGPETAGSPFAATFVGAETIERGRQFCLEAERRYGAPELARMWTAPGRFPTAAEIDDPVQWAARVVLDIYEP